jgi:hypothetical protein
LSVRSYGQAGSQTQQVLHISNPTTTLHLVTRLRIRGYLILSAHPHVIPVGCPTAETALLSLDIINSVNVELQSRRPLRVKAPMPEFNLPESVQSIPV